MKVGNRKRGGELRIKGVEMRTMILMTIFRDDPFF